MGQNPKLYGLKNCDTCRKALKAMPELELIDVRADGVPEAVLCAAYQIFGDRLVNTRSTTWRQLSDEERQVEPISLLQAHPALMKRPLITIGNSFFLSWNKEIEAEVQECL